MVLSAVLNYGPQLQLKLKYNSFRGFYNAIATAIAAASTTRVCILLQYKGSQCNCNVNATTI